MSDMSEICRAEQNRIWTRYVPCLLLLAQATLLLAGIGRNAVTIDEVCHLPAGISYWQKGEFWCYHHNPPFVRLLYSLPAVLMDTPIDDTHYRYEPGSRMPDCLMGKDFMLLNQKNYIAIFVIARSVVVGLTLLGSVAIFHFSRILFGARGANLSLALWCFDPNVLAHGGLVTTDMGSTVIGFIATVIFWKYLRSPSPQLAVQSGVWLGFTVASKFSFVILPVIWGGLALFHYACTPKPLVNQLKASMSHGLIVTFVSLLTLNAVYLFEGVGKRLGEFEFKSKGLTHSADGELALSRVNRFRASALGHIPVPLPEHFVQGFDSQLFDVDSGMYCKYMRGELREGPGWWYYYLYCALVKTPTGILLICLSSAGVWMFSRRFRLDSPTEAFLIVPVLVFTWAISVNTGMNNHFRYLLPVYPWVAVFAGRLSQLLETAGARSLAGRVWVTIGGACLLSAVVGVTQVCPHYLTYFNAPAGGPLNGAYHLADSNIDWGQGLLSVQEWVDEHHDESPVSLAYFGTMFPEILGIDYKLPPIGRLKVPYQQGVERVDDLSDISDAEVVGPVPGIHLISANYLLGVPFPAPNGFGGQSSIPMHAYSYFQRFKPREVLANSIFVYDLQPDEVNRVRLEMGLPSLDSTSVAQFRSR